MADSTNNPKSRFSFQLQQQELYNQYSFDEPWDGPNNAKLLSQIPREFKLDHVVPNHTGCQVIVGPETAWPGSQSRKLDEITDADDTTVLLVECETHPVPWISPQDLSEEKRRNLSPKARRTRMSADGKRLGDRLALKN